MPEIIMSCRRIPSFSEECPQDLNASCCECGGQKASENLISTRTNHNLPSPQLPLNCFCAVSDLFAMANKSRSLRSNNTLNKARRHSPWQRLFFVLLCAALCASARGCGPGRSFGFSHRRNFNHRPKPLVQKEHVPNIPEQTFAASGLTEGVIKRDTPSFRKLVWVESDYIVFKDEEGTGADRFMSRVSTANV